MRARHDNRPGSHPLDGRRIFFDFFFPLFLNLNLVFFSEKSAAYATERPIFLNSFLKLKIRGL